MNFRLLYFKMKIGERMTLVGADKNNSKFEAKPSTAKSGKGPGGRATTKDRWKSLAKSGQGATELIGRSSGHEKEDQLKAKLLLKSSVTSEAEGAQTQAITNMEYQAIFQVCSDDVPTLQPQQCQRCVRLYEPAFPCRFLA